MSFNSEELAFSCDRYVCSGTYFSDKRISLIFDQIQCEGNLEEAEHSSFLDAALSQPRRLRAMPCPRREENMRIAIVLFTGEESLEWSLGSSVCSLHQIFVSLTVFISCVNKTVARFNGAFSLMLKIAYEIANCLPHAPIEHHIHLFVRPEQLLVPAVKILSLVPIIGFKYKPSQLRKPVLGFVKILRPLCSVFPRVSITPSHGR